MSFFPVGMSAAGKIGTALNIAGGVSDLFGGSGDGVSGKALGAQRMQSEWLTNMQSHFNRQAKLTDIRDYKEHILPIEERRINEQVQRENQQIQMRVKDAKAAGLHPLFALGQPSSNIPVMRAGYSPGPSQSAVTTGIPGQSYTGSHKGDKLRAVGQAMLAMQQQSANIKLTEAQAAYYNSRIKTTEQHADATAETYPYDDTQGYFTPEGKSLRRQEHAKGEKRNYPGTVDIDGHNVRISNPGLLKRLESHYGEELAQILMIYPAMRDMLRDKSINPMGAKASMVINDAIDWFKSKRKPNVRRKSLPYKYYRR